MGAERSFAKYSFILRKGLVSVHIHMCVCVHTHRTLEFKWSSKYRWIQLLMLFIIKFSISSPAWKKLGVCSLGLKT